MTQKELFKYQIGDLVNYSGGIGVIIDRWYDHSFWGDNCYKIVMFTKGYGPITISGVREEHDYLRRL